MNRQVNPSGQETSYYSRLSQRLRNARLSNLDLGRSKARKGAFVLWATEPWTDRALELGNRGADGGSSLAAFGGHGYYLWLNGRDASIGLDGVG